MDDLYAMTSIRPSTEQHVVGCMTQSLSKGPCNQIVETSHAHRHTKSFTLSHMHLKLKAECDKPCMRGIMCTFLNARHSIFIFPQIKLVSSNQHSLQKFSCFSKPNTNSKDLGVSQSLLTLQFSKITAGWLS